MAHSLYGSLVFQGQVNAVVIEHGGEGHYGTDSILSADELKYVIKCQGWNATPEQCALEILFRRRCQVIRHPSHTEEAWRVVWGGDFCTPYFSGKGAAEACLRMYFERRRKPELYGHSEGLHTACWGIWETTNGELANRCNRCGEIRV